MRRKFMNNKTSTCLVRISIFFSSSSFFNKKSPFIVLPSGMSAAMTASSASNHRQYFTYFGYSALHNSERCLPVEISQQIVTC
jgi:hypothetical protein